MDNEITQKKKPEENTISNTPNPSSFVAPKKTEESDERKTQTNETLSSETDTLRGLMTSREFLVPKKPEETVVENTAGGGEILSDKKSVDLTEKELGWKTLTPTVEIEPKDITPKKDDVSPSLSKNIAPQKPLNKAPESSQEEASALPNIRTYKKDVAGTIRNQKTSLVRMVLEEQKVRANRELDESPQSRKNLPLISFSLIFLLLAVVLVYFAFFRGSGEDPTFTNLNIVPLIRTENNKEIQFTNQTPKEFSKDIRMELLNPNLKLDAIEFLYFTEKYSIPTKDGVVDAKKIITVSKLFGALNIPIPSNLVRSLKSDYMYGFHNFNRNQPFLILKTDYYDTTFAGMLEWEQSLLKDIYPLFGVSSSEDLRKRIWTDVIAKNKDTRVLKDFNEQTVLVYMFKDQKTLIITTSENTLFEVSRRLDLLKEKK